MTIEQMRYFLALAERLNFRVVAESFFITQPTLSRQIANMERELDTQLFFRKNPNVELTPAGEVLYQELQGIYASYERTVRKVKEVGAQSRGHLTIALEADQIISPQILRAIRIFAEKYPEVHISIQRSSFRELSKGMQDMSYDVGNTMFLDGFYLEKLECRTLSVDDYCLAISRELTEGYPDVITSEQALELIERTPLNLIADDYFVTSIDPAGKLRENTGIDIPDRCIRFVGDPLSVPLSISAGLCTTILNSTHVLSIDPLVRLLRIKGAVGYKKVAAYHELNRNPMLPEFLKILAPLLDEEQKL